MKTITLTKDNLENEHICCAISSSKDIQVKTKKDWIKEQLDKGLVFTKMDLRGKCFIEYIPLENAWVPISGENLIYIQCFWCAGKYQGQGYAKTLLEGCKKDALLKGKNGLVIISSRIKPNFLMNYDFLIKHGFYSVDTWNEEFELMFLPLNDYYKLPQFNCTKIPDQGLLLYYTDQCPFNVKYTKLLQDYCKERKIPLQLVHIENRKDALNAPTPMTTYSLFYKGHFITREVLTVKKFEKIWGELNEQN